MRGLSGGPSLTLGALGIFGRISCGILAALEWWMPPSPSHGKVAGKGDQAQI